MMLKGYGTEKEVITKASRIIAISENTKKDIVNILNIDPQKLTLSIMAQV